MDKLEPVLKHKFWILLALVAPLTIFGYYSANGALKEATEKRIGELDGIQTPTGNEANERWAEGLKVINNEYEKEVNAQIVRVWEEQKHRMVWPPRLVSIVPEKYRADFTAEGYGVLYSAEYGEQIRKLHASVEPVTADTRGRISGNGKVLFEEKQIPRQSFTGLLSVPSEMIWDAQEDIWFLQLLLDAVRNVNAPYENAAKSAVRAIYKVELWGGNGESSVKAAGGVGGSYGGGEEAYGGEMEMMMMMGRSGGDGMGLAGGSQAVKVEFNPAEEFGTGGQPAGMAAGNSMGVMGSMMMPEEMSMSSASGEGLSATAAPAKPLRYVKEDQSAPYRERGFYMSVLIDQRRIAEFLVELSNSEWPIRLGRFHVGPNREAAKGGGYGGSMGGPMMGMMGAGYPGMEGYSGYGEEMEMGIADYAGEEMSIAPGYGGEGGFGPPALNPTGESVQLLTHPDLVQLDLCGYITFYVPPPDEVLAAVQQAKTADSPATPAAGTTPGAESTPAVTAPEAPAGETATESPTTEAPSGVTAPDESTTPPPATDAAPGNAPGAAPPGDPASTPQAEETPS